MAYMNKEKKAKIVEAVKAVLPKGWKATFAIRHYSTIVCTIRSAPLDLKDAFHRSRDDWDFLTINTYHAEKQCKNKDIADKLEKIIAALNLDNYDNSDIMTDYFDVGHYVDLKFGSWDKPFKNSAA
ncbi:hypothetical protein M5b_00253 [Klebsiella phage VLCpiM5b]|nr:hypothetical protein M5b_00253 [Klebsiella phage VLCpiM5b]